jgi:hypothetical protein
LKGLAYNPEDCDSFRKFNLISADIVHSSRRSDPLNGINEYLKHLLIYGLCEDFYSSIFHVSHVSRDSGLDCKRVDSCPITNTLDPATDHDAIRNQNVSFIPLDLRRALHNITVFNYVNRHDHLTSDLAISVAIREHLLLLMKLEGDQVSWGAGL